MPPKPHLAERLSFGAIFVHIFLTVIKLGGGFMAANQAMISDGLNSFLDIISGTVTFVAIRVGNRKADNDHPYGHHRAEPIAALVIAILAGILSFEIIRDSLLSLFDKQVEQITTMTLVIVFISITTKIVMMIAFRKVSLTHSSPSLKAGATDFRNDIISSSLVLVSVISAKAGLSFVDPLVAILIGLWIGYSGFTIAQENIKFLMGETPDKALLAKLHAKALANPEVKGVNAVKAQFLGSHVEVAVNINLDHTLPLDHAHQIGEDVQRSLMEIPEVCQAFVHIDPV